jgi:hypothetical protein
MAGSTNGTAAEIKTTGDANGKGRVAVWDNEVVLNDFHETDLEVVALALGAADPETAMHNAFEVGARAIKLAEVSQDARIVERAFGELHEKFDAKLDETISELGEASDALIDEEDGALPKALHGFKDELETLLGEAFDPDSKRSIIGRFDALLRGLRNEEREAVRELLDPGNDRSPIHRLHRDLTKAVREEADGIRKLVGELSEKIAASEAAAEMFEKTSLKGGSFEDTVHAVVSALVGPFGDMAEQTGAEVGCAGTKKGDEVVTLNPDDTNGCTLRIALEVKDRSLPLAKTFAELEQAMANRDAHAGIAVFSREDHAPMPTSFSYSGSKAIVVLDKDDLDSSALRLGLMWARWMVRRQLAGDQHELDTEAIQRLIEDAARALKRHTTIKRCHSTASKKIDEAASQVEDLVGEVDDALERLRIQLQDD